LIQGVTIRQVGVDALPAIMPVMDRAFDPAFGEAWSLAQCQGMMALPGSFLLCAERGPDVTAFALCRSVMDEAELLLFAVDPKFQRQGIGQSLLDEVILECQYRDIGRLHLEVRSDNPALRIYTSNGFARVGMRANYYRRPSGQMADAITLAKNLR
jgi:[ribosomal protein S18]-alanine N-acetyltransferase